MWKFCCSAITTEMNKTSSTALAAQRSLSHLKCWRCRSRTSTIRTVIEEQKTPVWEFIKNLLLYLSEIWPLVPAGCEGVLGWWKKISLWIKVKDIKIKLKTPPNWTLPRLIQAKVTETAASAEKSRNSFLLPFSLYTPWGGCLRVPKPSGRSVQRVLGLPSGLLLD